MLQLNDKWVWDFWFAVEGANYHMFYLQADKALKNPDLRHWNVSIGHAVSKNLRDWTILPDAISPTQGDDEAADSYTTWTGCVIQHNHEWYMYYTGTQRSEKGLVQRVCLARSRDLLTWEKHDKNPIVELDNRWYDGLNLEYWHDASWRDPWVFKDPIQDIYHMLVTCRVNRGEPDGRGAIGYASSKNALDWTVGDAFLAPGWFGEMEVPQIEKIGSHYYVFCSVSARFHSVSHRSSGVEPQTGVKYFMSNSLLTGYHTLGNGFLTKNKPDGLYSGRVIKGTDGKWYLMAFKGNDEHGHFVGSIIDPILIEQAEDGRLSLVE